MSPSRRKELSASGLSGAAKRAGGALLIHLAISLAGLVVLGMATGTHLQFDKGQAYLWVVISVQAFGVISLLTLGGLARACIGVWKRHSPPVLCWTALAISIWAVWAFLRICEYAS